MGVTFSLVKSEEWKVKSEKSRWRGWDFLFSEKWKVKSEKWKIALTQL